MHLWEPPLIIGSAALLGALGAYLRDTTRPVFPVVLALVGVFLCGAQAVKATIGPNDTTIEFSRQVVAAAETSNDVLSRQNTTLQLLGKRMDTLEEAVRTLQGALNTQRAQASAPPVTVPQLQALDASRPALRDFLQGNLLAHQRASNATNELRNAAAGLSQ